MYEMQEKIDIPANDPTVIISVIVVCLAVLYVFIQGVRNIQMTAKRNKNQTK